MMQPEQSVSELPEPFRRDRVRNVLTANQSEAFRNTRREEITDTAYALLENAGIGIYGLDLNGFVTFVNPAARRMTGWTLEDLHGRTQHSMVHHSHADGRNYPREECPIYMAFHDGRTHSREDEVFWRKDGSLFPVEYMSTPIFKHGKLTGAVVVFSDISDRVRRRDWDQAKIGVLKGILRGHSLDATIDALCDAFAAFQRGYTLCTQRTVKQNVEAVASAQDVSGSPLLKELTVTNVTGSVLATLSVHGRHKSSETAKLDEILVEIGFLLEAAYNQQSARLALPAGAPVNATECPSS